MIRASAAVPSIRPVRTKQRPLRAKPRPRLFLIAPVPLPPVAALFSLFLSPSAALISANAEPLPRGRRLAAPINGNATRSDPGRTPPKQWLSSLLLVLLPLTGLGLPRLGDLTSPSTKLGAVRQRRRHELAATRPIPQRMDRDLDRHAGSEGLRPPALPCETGGAAHLDGPLLLGAVLGYV